MCNKVVCKGCGKASWVGCGLHVQLVLSNIPVAERCPNWKSGLPCGIEDFKDARQEVEEMCLSPVLKLKDFDGERDPFFKQIQSEAREVIEEEPELSKVLNETVLLENLESFEDVVAATVCQRLELGFGNTKRNCLVDDQTLESLIRETLHDNYLELGHTCGQALRRDSLAVCERDPAMSHILEVVLFSKGYGALVCHRVAYRLWHKKKRYTASYLQSLASAKFGLDIHPATQIGVGVMFDHGTGIVIGETAVVGHGCTILHGVTLGGTGKESGDRHPKVGNHVLIGANVSVLGNIRIGHSVKIGAGSVVIRPIPHHATAVGVPAKIIGRVLEQDPGDTVDTALVDVQQFHKAKLLKHMSSLSSTGSTLPTTASTTDASESSDYASDTTSASCERNTDQLCPFRGLNDLAQEAPGGTVTICTLLRIFKPMGASQCRLGAAFYELDTLGVGHVHWDRVYDEADIEDQEVTGSENDDEVNIEFVERAFVERASTILSEYTGLPKDEVQAKLIETREKDELNYGGAKKLKKHRCCRFHNPRRQRRASFHDNPQLSGNAVEHRKTLPASFLSSATEGIRQLLSLEEKSHG